MNAEMDVVDVKNISREYISDLLESASAAEYGTGEKGGGAELALIKRWEAALFGVADGNHPMKNERLLVGVLDRWVIVVEGRNRG